MLTRLGHGTIGGRDDQDATIHTGGTSDHVLDIICVTWAINVTIMTGLGLVLDCCGVDGDTSGLLFRALIDISVVFELDAAALGQILGDSSSQRGFSVIDVTCT